MSVISNRELLRLLKCYDDKDKYTLQINYSGCSISISTSCHLPLLPSLSQSVIQAIRKVSVRLVVYCK